MTMTPFREGKLDQPLSACAYERSFFAAVPKPAGPEQYKQRAHNTLYRLEIQYLKARSLVFILCVFR